MILYSNCKINLGLQILARRADGYHELRSVMYPLSELCDVVELLPDPLSDSVTFSSSGLEVGADPEKNLCVKAYRAVQSCAAVGGVKIHLHKMIPMGAGLGGGSADATYVIRGLNELFGLGFSVEQMEQIAATIGSDTPFFVRNTPAMIGGRGEILTPTQLSLKGWHLVVVKPPFGISTAEAYSGVTPCLEQTPLEQSLALPVERWSGALVNDFERSLFKSHPQLSELKERLYRAGATYAAMSGSGSALFGLFKTKSDLKPLFPDCFLHQEQLR